MAHLSLQPGSLTSRPLFHPLKQQFSAPASPGNLLEVQILRPYPRSTESEILGVVPTICVLTSSPGDTDAPQAGESVLGVEVSPAPNSSHTFALQGLFLTPRVCFQSGHEVCT